ncbi:hypothetical protein PS938_02520 [Pseudomonas fluorescens]|uniref:Transmembrane protein n=1 Tax=Pseudomonas fluorescens TaxID=294 RepID=A0A5E7U0S2_PSEFL|nr:hypothetical protein [Pseudomonas fluorescens]VVQ01464.1 hypothetical protein PS938_02520 [Pseudomonas fluorescens]
MNAEKNLQNEALKSQYRRMASKYLYACYALLFIGVIAVLTSPLDFKPSFETPEVWFQRSGALMTVFALLAALLKDMGTQTLHKPGYFGDALKLEVLAELEQRFEWVFWFAFLFTVLGTLVWGYGDTYYKFVILHQR